MTRKSFVAAVTFALLTVTVLATLLLLSACGCTNWNPIFGCGGHGI